MSRADQDAHGENPAVQYSYDAMGRLIRAQLGDILSRWEFDGESGLVCSYSRENTARADSVERTEVIRDEQGRIVGLDSADGLVVYTYDAAGQLTGSRAGDLEFEWVFEAGLMVSERTWRHSSGTGESEETSRVLAGERSFAYNRLNQLTEIIATDRTAEHTSTTVTTYEYNAAGERTREIITNDRGVQRVREYAWGAYSGLASVTDTYVTAHGGEAASRVRMVTDVTGELAQVAGVNGVSVPLLWEPDAAIPQILGAGGMPAPGSDGGFSQVGIAGGFDPWAVPPILGSAPDAQGMNIPGLPRTSSADDSGVWGSMLPAGFSFTGAGSVRVAGLDVMGARVFDGASKRFLSTDPLAQVPGTGFFADVYAFCGNNPVGLMDPWGLKPMSPDEFQKYSQEQYDKFWQGVRNVGEWVATVAMIGFGAVLGAMATGLGPLGGAAFGAASGALMGAGMYALEQKVSGKSIDWGKAGQEAIKGAITGAVSGAIGGGFTNLAKLKDLGKLGKVGNFVADNKLIQETVKDGVTQGTGSTVEYFRQGGRNPQQAVGMFFIGTGTGGLGAVTGNRLKTKMKVPGYGPGSNETMNKFNAGFRTAVADGAGGSVREATRYTAETVAYQKEFNTDTLWQKTSSGFAKDAFKSGVRSGTKMDDSTAASARSRMVHPVQTTQAAAMKIKDGVKEGVDNFFTPPALR